MTFCVPLFVVAQAIAEGEQGRMEDAEYEQCRVDRFWGYEYERAQEVQTTNHHRRGTDCVIYTRRLLKPFRYSSTTHVGKCRCGESLHSCPCHPTSPLMPPVYPGLP